MDIDPHSSNWSPSYLDAKRNQICLQSESVGNAIGSPPPSSPKCLWNGNFSPEMPGTVLREANGTMMTVDANTTEVSDLSFRVREISLHPKQPMIICETVEDEKDVTGESISSNTVSLTVPPIDVSNEKKRPPLSAPY